jgi:hypothetical protein
MIGGRKTGIAVAVLVLLAVAAAGLWLSGIFKRKSLVLKGAVITNNTDPRRQQPIADANVAIRLSSSASNSRLSRLFSLNTSAASPLAEASSDSSGFFSITLPKEIRHGESIIFDVRHSDYKPLAMPDYVGDQLYVLRMEPTRRETAPQPRGPEVSVGNVLVRYSTQDKSSVNIGSAARTFEVVNKGNVPCHGHDPCSPDGRWKGATGSVSLEAGPGNEFHNARASCIAGPCPFTRIDDSGLTAGGPTIRVSALDWSDTAVFLVEAEVVRPMISNVIRESHPFQLGRALNFTVPATAEGITLQAELNGETVVFPLGPALILDWADCTAQMDAQKNKAYRCELKPGYRFAKSS